MKDPMAEFFDTEGLKWVWLNRQGEMVSGFHDTSTTAIREKVEYCDCSVEKLYELGLRLAIVKVKVEPMMILEMPTNE